MLWDWTDDRAAAFARAEQALAQLNVIEPDRSITLLARASLTNVGNDWNGLLAIGDRLAEQYPNEPPSHHHRCSALLRLARFDDSIAACARATRISPRDSRVSVWQGLTGFNLLQLDRHAQAEQQLRASVLDKPAGAVLRRLAGRGDRRAGPARRSGCGAEGDAGAPPAVQQAWILRCWVATDARFIAGRDRIVAVAAPLGLPP